MLSGSERATEVHDSGRVSFEVVRKSLPLQACLNHAMLWSSRVYYGDCMDIYGVQGGYNGH